MVACGRPPAGRSIPYVAADDRGGARVATERLLAVAGDVDALSVASDMLARLVVGETVEPVELPTELVVRGSA